MAKFYGKIGFKVLVEESLDKWIPSITEREYYGDILQFSRSLQNSGEVNDNVNITNKFSIVADPFAYENFSNILYVVWMGTKWKAESITVDYPRLEISIGGVYND